jgi:hypothetical protein
MTKTAQNTEKPEKKELNYKQQAFVDEYPKDNNGKQAAIRAGYSAHTAEVKASQLLRLVKVKQAIDAKRQASSAKAGITADWIESKTRHEAETASLATDRLRALDMLGRHLPAYYKQDTEQPPEQARKLNELEQAEARRLASLRIAELRRGSGQAGDVKPAAEGA